MRKERRPEDQLTDAIAAACGALPGVVLLDMRHVGKYARVYAEGRGSAGRGDEPLFPGPKKRHDAFLAACSTIFENRTGGACAGVPARYCVSCRDRNPDRKRPTMNSTQVRTLNALWTAGNNAGNGYAPAEETVEDAVAALVADGWTIEHEACDSVSILSRDGEYVGIGDANGAWAVDLEVRREVAPNADNDEPVAEARATYAADLGLETWQVSAEYEGGEGGQREVIVCTCL